MDNKIAIIGAGNMGEAIVNGLISEYKERSADIIVSDISQDRLDVLKKKYGVLITISNIEAVKKADVVILAVKPKDMDSVLLEIAPVLNEKKLLVSIAAGITTTFIEKRLNKKIAVVRAMPNMPALIGKGVTAISVGSFSRKENKELAIKILSGIGEVVEVEEKLIDTVTAISGSGPAYFFFLIEKLIDIGVKQGLDKDIAKKLAIETAIGSGLIVLETEEDASSLRKKVTSKGGTTEAAFKVFEEAGLGDILEKGVKAAIEKSKSLAAK